MSGTSMWNGNAGSPRSWCILIAGIAVSSFGIALSSRAGIGATPQAALPNVLYLNLPGTLGMWSLAVSTILLAIEIIITRRWRNAFILLQLPAVVAGWILVDAAMRATDFISPGTYIERWILTLAAVLLIATGTLVSLKADITLGPPDGIVRVISDRTGRDFGVTKLGFDIAMVLLAFIASYALSGTFDGVREGTVASMVLIGPTINGLRALSTRIARTDSTQRRDLAHADFQELFTDHTPGGIPVQTPGFL